MAGGTHISIADEKMYFEFTSKLKRNLIIGMAVGIVMFAIGVGLLMLGIGEHAAESHALAGGSGGGGEYHWSKRVWANLWLNTYYFNGIALIGVFFLAYNYVGWAGWSGLIKRIPEAFGYFLPITLVLFLVLFFLGGHHIFHWTHADLYDPKSHHYDPIIAGKSGYLNTPFFIARMLFFFGAWIGLFFYIRSLSLKEDKLTDLRGYLQNPTIYNRIVYVCAIFLVVFAVSSSMMAWDWVMSIDTHWYSTMFGWYSFASLHVAGLATITLAVIYLKEAGYLKAVSKHHLHDLGKFMFAFSVFWTYIWFSQFLLIYYAHIPEETIYFQPRLFGHYRPVFFLNVFINFVFPFLALMTKESKRTMIILKIVAFAILAGHYLDFYMMVMPGTVGNHGGFGLVEFGTILIFACAFIYVFALNLSKAPLIAKNHPFMKESLFFTQFN